MLEPVDVVALGEIFPHVRAAALRPRCASGHYPDPSDSRQPFVNDWQAGFQPDSSLHFPSLFSQMPPMTQLALIFDIGNVLIRWDARLLYRQLLPDEAAIDAFFAEVDFHAWNVEFDRGTPWDEGVATLAARHPHHAQLIAAFHHRWHETVAGPVEGAPELLAELAEARVPLYAITNFSSAKLAETRARYPFLANAFRDVVVSGDERLLKPDPEIYRRCLARNALDPARAIFIDDSPANVAAASALGIDAIRFTTTPALRDALTGRGVLPAEPA